MTLDRFTVAWWLALAAVATTLCFVALFDLLGFMFAFAMAIPLTVYGGAVGVRARRHHADSHRAVLDALPRVLLAAVVPLVPITLNALRVPNCDYLEGLAFYGLVTVAGGLFAACWGVAIGRLSPARGVWWFVALLVVSVGLGAARFWFEPPVDVYHPFFAYWPGAIYDDVILIDDRLLWSRLEDACWAITAVAVSAVQRARRGTIAIAAIALAAAIGARIGATEHAVHRDADWLEARLGGVTETEHIRMIHPADLPAEDAERLSWELEFAYAELKAFFGIDLTRKATVWLYPDADTKKRLMGARRVRIAKPWQWAFHAHGAHVGQSVLIHELAHVFSAELADGPHHLSLYKGLVPHMPIIEGLAEAATWKTDRLDLHQWSKAMRAIDVAPPLEAVLAPAGFYGRNSRTAYTLCGSFTRYFRDVEGPDALAEAYRTGTFERPGGPPLTERIADWQRFVDAKPLDEAALAHARARYDRPSIFGRACAHEIAALRKQARAAEPERALALTDEILGHLPRDISARAARAALLLRLGRRDAARAVALELAEDDDAGAVARARARERLGDIDALADRLDAAREAYDAALSAAFPRSTRRRLQVKRAALDAGPAGAGIIEYLARPGPWKKGERTAALDALVSAHPDLPLPRYLRGRLRLSNGDRLAGLDDLTRAAPGLDGPDLGVELRRLAADALFDARCYVAAGARFDGLAEDARLDRGETLEYARWARRARFFAGRAGPAPTACAEIDMAAAGLDDAAGIGR